jgi:hypothetical protein
MLEAIIDAITGRKFLPNAQYKLQELAKERATLTAVIPTLEGKARWEAELRLYAVQDSWTNLDRWFDEYGYPKVATPVA